MLSRKVAASLLAANVAANNSSLGDINLTTNSSPTTKTVDWNYNLNGNDWYLKYPLCIEGKKQSPINLLKSAPLNDIIKIIGYNYFDFRLDSTSYAGAPDKTMAFPEKAKAQLEVTSVDESKALFTAKNIRFHAPSEHTIDGK